MPTVRLDKVSLSFGLKPLLDRAVLQIRKRERVCLLGRNGEGKSSLLQLITGQILADSGEVWVRPGARIASLAQEVAPASDATVREMLMSVFESGAAAPGAAAHGDWQAELQVDQVISRLQLDRDAPMTALSGGWRRRVMLGRALVSQPDLLLLDEPTNHLDIDAITWLEDMMQDFDGALMFISHDRAFVRRLATRIVELDRGQLRVWPGNYDDYLVQKRAALEVEARHAALFDKKLAQEEVWIRQGVEARRTRNEGRVRALKQLRIQRSERRERIGQVEIRVQDAAPSGKLVFEATHVTQTFGASPVIADFSTRIMRGDRIGIIGPNGCGKTTLIKLLVGELEPTQGKIFRGTQLLPAYFDQQREQLDPSASIMDNVTGGSGDTVTIDGQPRHVSGYLRDFLFPPERLHAPVSMLSGGERNRLLLARLFARPSNLLVMDEPTNDLDVETLELLEEMVANYTGTLLLVSHDRAFLDNVVTSTLVFEGQSEVNEYVGGYSDWLRQRAASGADKGRPPAPAATPPVAAAPAAAATVAEAPAPARAQPKARRLTYKDRRELAAMPELIQRLEAEQQQLQADIADPALFQGNHERGALALQRLQALAVEIENAYARWDALES
ncbi:MAG TPA: ATP-binding cassette domain-containing protein [Steroidobacteraceae bacterium]|jgi:ATP-binding cassette subfamily F protein uup|nr:ATP-binding cassette domain-containing protein [Steroidobacteraceae bacterium]